jgi:hypothetical protein
MHQPARGLGESKDINVLDYDVLPACARSCKMLQISGGNCISLAAPTSDLSTYRDCVCQSDYLRSLYASGVAIAGERGALV